MEDELLLTNLLDMETLQRIQDAFYKMTGQTVCTTDANGVIIGRGSNYNELCMKYARKSEVGSRQCEQCARYGVEQALKNGRSKVYYCHAGLLNFATPIIVQDEIIACLIGGQVILEELDPDRVKKHAVEIGVDPEGYYEAAKKIKIMTQEEVDNAEDFLYTLADIFSGITYNRYLLFHANIELGRTVKMRSDFLANMSHEIRTPMNAVIGMAEMAMREALPPAARGYLNQIKIAGNSLLTIINDILDFSKIEANKMDIIPAPYEPMSILNDVSSIIMTRLKDKDVELILDIPPDLPNKLMGDAVRIKQIILNIANNAAKFTYKGRIIMKMEINRLSEDNIELHISVDDSGIGIKREDIDKLFQSFSQVDSKRNRNIEGTGLGLAISKQLLGLMHGSIRVESEYGKGSKFSMVCPQKIVDPTPSISIKDPKSIMAVGLVSNPYIKESLKQEIKKLGVEYLELQSSSSYFAPPEGKKIFYFIEDSMFNSSAEAFVRDHPEHMAVLIVDFFNTTKYDLPNFTALRKPLFLLNIASILNQEDLQIEQEQLDEVQFDFVAPLAEILIVDDNAINLTVAVGLLEPLNMKIDTALSGKEAIDKISVHHYDIIFMDHMMPDLDGVETTHIIRRFHKEYNDVPIIALTANAVDGTKEMFCREGMNDFIAKPIEFKLLLSKVKQWLPIEKIERADRSQTVEAKPTEVENIQIGDLDVRMSISLLGSEKLFWNVLKDFYKVIEKKAAQIKSFEEKEDWAGYTIEVHALKSAAKQIGAIALSDKAAAMEKAGNARDAALIHQCTDELLHQYVEYIPVLQPFCTEEKKSGSEEKHISAESLYQCFADMKTAVEDLDMDQMEAVIDKMDAYCYEGWQGEMFAQLKEAVEEVDVDACESIINEWAGKY